MADYFLLNTFNTMEAKKNSFSEPRNSSCSIFQHKQTKSMVPPAQSHFLQQEDYFTTIYVHTRRGLPSEIAKEIEDILERPPTEKQFDMLKEAILSRLERSDNAKLRELLNNVSMGDRTPSQLLHFMKSLLGRRHMDERIMRQFWFEKLPQTMTHISEEKTPSQLAELTDRIVDTYHQKPSVSQVSSENHKEYEAVM